MPLPRAFLELSQQIGANPLLVQAAGGNTSIKTGDNEMWIKASGTELAQALEKDIFVAVDRDKAQHEIDHGPGDCKGTLIDPSCGLRPSIETTFHALFDATYVFHYHSVGVICHAIAEQGKALLDGKLQGMNWAWVPYCKPGIPLTRAIRDAIADKPADVIVLANHGVIITGEDLDAIASKIEDVEKRLHLPLRCDTSEAPREQIDDTWVYLPKYNALAIDEKLLDRARSGTYYPDHVVFLGPGLPAVSPDSFPAKVADLPVPAVIVEGRGVYMKCDATPAHHAMLQCILDVLGRVPEDWTLVPIGEDAEAELLNWDAEKYRQALAKK